MAVPCGHAGPRARRGPRLGRRAGRGPPGRVRRQHGRARPGAGGALRRRAGTGRAVRPARSAVGLPDAGPRCGRSWETCWASRPDHCGSGPRPWGSPSSIEGPASSRPSGSISRIRPASRSSPCAGAARWGWTSSTCARSPRPSGSSRRSSPRPNRSRSPRSPGRTASRRSCGAGPARRPCSRDSAWGSRACRRGMRPGSAHPA